MSGTFNRDCVFIRVAVFQQPQEKTERGNKWRLFDIPWLWRCTVHEDLAHVSLWGSCCSTMILSSSLWRSWPPLAVVLCANGLCCDWGQFWEECHTKKCVFFSRSLCQTSFWRQSGETKLNVAFVKMHGAIFIKPLTPCKISGRCFQRRPGDPLRSHI